ncbi:MAG: hypothetical protein RBS92_02465 [Candidatus Cloacimonadales bacterium]|jgi:hypothetical protein|nr:hypothetical protein [Candidatus Cloacimonadales bacterium]
MMKYLIILIILIASCALFADKQVMIIDSLYQISVINKDDAQELKLFSNYPGFTQAKLYLDEENNLFFEIIYSGESGLEIATEYVNDDELQSIKDAIHKHYANKTNALESEGKIRMILGYGYLTLGFYGYAIPLSFNLDGETAAGLYFLDSGLILGGLIFASNRANISNADADMSVSMATRGIIHGALLAKILDEEMDQSALGIMTLTSMSEGYLGYKFSRMHNITEGQANAIPLYHDYIGAQFLLLANAANALEEGNATLMSAGALLSFYSGLPYGYYKSKQIDFTKGDAIAARTTWIMYGFGSMAISQMADLNQAQGSILFALSSAVGMLHGESIAKKQQLTTSQGNYLAVSTVAGALMGSGVSYLLKMDKHLPLSSVGSIAGYYLYSSTQISKHNQKKEDTKTSFNASINPFAYKTNSPILNFALKF